MNAKHRYVVTHVEGTMTDRVHVGTIMVDKHRHDASGWTDWQFHTDGMPGISGAIVAYHIGPHRDGVPVTVDMLTHLRRSASTDIDAFDALDAAIKEHAE